MKTYCCVRLRYRDLLLSEIETYCLYRDLLLSEVAAEDSSSSSLSTIQPLGMDCVCIFLGLDFSITTCKYTSYSIIKCLASKKTKQQRV